eukprot:CAMPEP_0198251178 /NCGR_PEP_ID=MMETSP1447-20131203/2099_1 /TAXON_ID=420782 /ORGANISM="Chaetoceros dichaeta, Strain CCMP1751" /LENGTH=149 /DNA_ID=CAMNT_0043936141 /DNA_START=68 /DNA_END=517 /DNA_ORIENTATION=+
MNRDYSDPLISTAASDLSNDDILKLKKRVRHLESELSVAKEEAYSKEEMLQNLLKDEVQKCLKFRTDLEVAKREQTTAENELKCARQEQKIADASIKQVQKSAHDLSVMAVTDREWLEEEMSRRSALTKATQQKCELELARMRRRATLT